MTEITDEALVLAVQQGSSTMFGELISRYEAKLKRYAYKFLANQDDIEDLVQEVFIKAYTNIQAFDPKLRFSPWLYRIAHNTYINELKRKSRYGFNIFDVDTVLPLLPAKETADAQALDEELKAELDHWLSLLPPKYREVIVLHYLEDLSYLEISDVLQIPVTTVGVRMTRARAKLQANLKNK